MIPLLGPIALAGGHPLALSLLIGIFGLILGYYQGGSRLVRITSPGVAGGLLIFMGFEGALSRVDLLREWSLGLEDDGSMGYVALAILVVNIFVYAYLARIEKRWLSIPVCSASGLVIALVLGAGFDPQFKTKPGLPHFDPDYWWGSTDKGWQLGLPHLGHFIASLPYAILAVALWPPDFLSHRVFQELNFPRNTEKIVMDVDDTITTCSLRQMFGSVFGDANITSSWGTYLIPAAEAKRPIPGGAIILGVFVITVAVLGYPMDVVSWPPVMRVSLLVGVFIPLLEAGINLVETENDAQAAAICLLASVTVDPVIAWALTMMLDNNGLAGNIARAEELSFLDRIVIPAGVLIVSIVAMSAVGMMEEEYGIQPWM
jgi:hypothetical protein